MRLFGLADCNNFYCSCERVFHPDLNGKPVVVLSNNDGCVIARSNESKVLGLKMGDPFYQVQPLLEANNVAVFSSNYNLYGDMSRRVMSMLAEYSPKLDVYSIDETFLDFSGMELEGLTAYGQQIVKRVGKGTGIPISLGIAPTKTLAKMASKFAKKYKGYKGCCLIDTNEKREKALKLFPVEDVWGVGFAASRKLKCYGVETAWDLTQRSESWVRAMMHVTGVRTWKELRGESCVSIDELPHKKSICTSRSFSDKGLDKLADMEEAVANFAAQCYRKLRDQHCVCGCMSVFAYTSPFNQYMPSDQFNVCHSFDVASNSLTELVKTAVAMLRQCWKGDGLYHYKKSGVVIWNLVSDSAIQLSLFDRQDRPKMQSLMEAVDAINRKNGHNCIRTAIQSGNKRWKLKTEHISKQYTTNLNDVLHLKVE